MKKNYKFVMCCNIIAGICFGIVSYGYFYRVRMVSGVLFAVLAVLQAIMAWKNYKQKENE